MRDGRPVVPPRNESKPNNDTTSLLSVWLNTYDAGSRATTSYSDRSYDGQASEKGSKELTAAPCCLEAREQMYGEARGDEAVANDGWQRTKYQSESHTDVRRLGNFARADVREAE